AIAALAQSLPSHSWEYGTAANALLELHNPSLTVFDPSPFPADKIPWADPINTDALLYAAPHIATDGPTLFPADKTGTADPAALGVSAVLLGQSDPTYLTAARHQAEYLLRRAPRFPHGGDGDGDKEGAISHRTDGVEAWSDFVAMAPPFLAYYAVAASDKHLTRAAVSQIVLYSHLLAANGTGPERGLWRHVRGGGAHADPGFWATGNGWVAYGIARTLATVAGWGPTSAWRGEREALVSLVGGLLEAVVATDGHRREERLLGNYLADSGSFEEAAGTALLAAAVYRMVVLEPRVFGGRYVRWADKKRMAVLKEVDAEGRVRRVVNPLDHASTEPMLKGGSPEAQAFVVMMWAARRECVRVG
ncbi:hypothetical protein M501DRAFT_920606, partial [Patellaria atrata CBS 101060]